MSVEYGSELKVFYLGSDLKVCFPCQLYGSVKYGSKLKMCYLGSGLNVCFSMPVKYSSKLKVCYWIVI